MWYHNSGAYPMVDPTTNVRFEAGEATESEATDWVLGQPVLTETEDPAIREAQQAADIAASRAAADAQEAERVAAEEALLAQAALDAAKAQEAADAQAAADAAAKAAEDAVAVARAEQIAKEKAEAAAA